MSIAVEAVGWGYRHAGRTSWALHGLDLTVRHGERVLLAGASGAGKSTLLGAIAGLLDADHSGEERGSLRVFGVPAAQARGRVGMVFSDPETQLVMARAGDDVAFGLENHAVAPEEIWPRVDEALELVGFGFDRGRPTGRLSGGEKQRLVLAGILALRPSLLLLDEPTANLDPEGALLVRKTVASVVEETGATLIIVEHRVAEWTDLVDRVVVVEPGGGVTTDGDPGIIFATTGESLASAGIWVPGVPLPTADTVGARSRSGGGRAVLEGDRLSYHYPGAPPGSPPAVDEVSLQLRAGEIVTIVGANGSGKSTLAVLLAGLLRPTAGTTRALEPGRVRHEQQGRQRRQNQRALDRWRARDLVRLVGTVFQDPEHQFLTGSVRAELALGPNAAGRPPGEVDRRVDELLAGLRLDHVADANPFTLSGGEKRRLSVATAVATGPRVLVLDEPTFGQDRRTWIELLRLLADLAADGHAICCVSHDPDFVAALGNPGLGNPGLGDPGLGDPGRGGRRLRMRSGRLEPAA